METRREVLWKGAATVIAAALGAACEPTTLASSATSRNYRIGYLKGRGVAPCAGQQTDWQFANGVALRIGRATGDTNACPEDVMLKALEDRGFRVGRNLEMIVASPDPPDDPQGSARIAAEIVRRQVDLIVTESTGRTAAARDLTATIPIVMHNVGDVVESGLVPNLARPGGNVTGVTMHSLDMALKRVEMLKEAFPWVREPILAHGGNVPQMRTVGPAVELATRLGLAPHPVLMNAATRALPDEVRALEDSANAMNALAAGADSLVIIAGQPSAAALLAIVKQHRLPAVFNSQSYMNEGGALLFDDVVDMVAVADYVARILKGAKPGDLPVLLPTEFQLYVNLKAADALGTPLASSVVARATRVVK